eukprot:COSAG01_NODE_36149_length_521_cov_1.649289_2_plen_49_part_01
MHPGDKANQPLPKVVDALKSKEAVAVACGRDFTVVLTGDQEVYGECTAC